MAVELLAESGGSLRLGLYGEVGWEITTAGVTRALSEAGGKPITISVDSYGGDALQGIAIHNILARYPGKKTAVIEGVAASAASLFPLAADTRIMPSNGFLMIHNAWGGVMGDADDMRGQADVLERISAAYRRTYSANTALNEDEVQQMMSAETWLSGEDCVLCGFATEVSEPRDIKAMASVHRERFVNPPEALIADQSKTEDEPAESSVEPETEAMAEAVSHIEASPEVNTIEEESNNLSTMSDQAAIEAASVAAREDERARAKTIRAICEQAKVSASIAEQLVEGGNSVAEAREIVLDKITSQAETVAQPADIGLTKKEAKSFSFRRAINALSNPNDRAAQQAAAFEFEVSAAAQEATGRTTSGIQVPYEVLTSNYRADLTVGTPADGGYLVDDELRSGDFIELLRNRMSVMQLGATMLSGLQGDISIPRQISSSTAYWVGEGGSPTESQLALDQINLSPKTLGAYQDYSRKLLLQSSLGVESMIRDDLTKVLALEIDRAALYGTGSSNQPLGLSGTSGIASVELTQYGSFSEMVDLESAIFSANADGNALRYCFNAATRGALKTTEKATGTNGVFVFEDGEVNGYQTVTSNQVANKDIFFGDWSQFIVAMWGGLDLMTDPYAGATAGNVRVIALQSVDFAVKQPTAFAYGQDLV